MWWLVVGVVIIGILAYAPMRKALLGIVALMVIVVTVWYVANSLQEAVAKKRIALSELEFVDVRLQKPTYGSFYEIVGRVRNHSPQYTASQITLLVTIEDCVDDTTCDVVWEGNESPLIYDLPPGQARDFEIHAVGDVDMGVKGALRWHYRLIGVSGRRPR